MTRIFWDTNLFVYLFEGGEFSGAVKRIYARMETRGDQLYTSALTLGELQVLPLRENPEQAARLVQALRSAATIVPFDELASHHYASIRLDRGVKPADAIQLACAAAIEADLFLTNDDRLSNRNVKGIKFISSLAQAPV